MSYTRGNPPVHWHSIDTITNGLLAPQASAAFVAWPTANLAIYVPVIVRSRVVVRQLWYANWGTGTGNYDIGLYGAGGTALLRKGSTAKSTTQEETVWDCTDTTIGPGVYYLALVSSTDAETFYCFAPNAPVLAATGVWTEAAALPLPATATFAVNQTLAVMPVIGMFLDTRVT